VRRSISKLGSRPATAHAQLPCTTATRFPILAVLRAASIPRLQGEMLRDSGFRNRWVPNCEAIEAGKKRAVSGSKKDAGLSPSSNQSSMRVTSREKNRSAVSSAYRHCGTQSITGNHPQWLLCPTSLTTKHRGRTICYPSKCLMQRKMYLDRFYRRICLASNCQLSAGYPRYMLSQIWTLR
jgi:hypothetical protein